MGRDAEVLEEGKGYEGIGVEVLEEGKVDGWVWVRGSGDGWVNMGVLVWSLGGGWVSVGVVVWGLGGGGVNMGVVVWVWIHYIYSMWGQERVWNEGEVLLGRGVRGLLISLLINRRGKWRKNGIYS